MMANRALFPDPKMRRPAPGAMSHLSYRTRTHPSAIHETHGDLNLCFSVENTEEYLHTALRVRWLLNNSNETVQRSTFNTDILTDLEIRTGCILFIRSLL